jgi:starvation-inducible DNA-binding protein
MQHNIGLADDQREGVVNALTTLLADEYVLYTKTRNYHWNVTGPQFHTLHELFEDQYKELNEIVDDMAERTRALGGSAIGTLAEFGQRTRLKEHPGHYPEAHAMLANLLTDHEMVIRQLRSDAEACEEEHQDVGTHDFLVATMSWVDEHRRCSALCHLTGPPPVQGTPGRPRGRRPGLPHG